MSVFSLKIDIADNKFFNGETSPLFSQSQADAVSTFKISLPTPIMSGVRTPTRQFSSCVLIECGDSLDSINATSSAIVKTSIWIFHHFYVLILVGMPEWKWLKYHNGNPKRRLIILLHVYWKIF